MCRGGGSKLRLRSWFKFEGRILWMREEYNKILIVVLVLSVLPSTNSYVDIVWSRVVSHQTPTTSTEKRAERGEKTIQERILLLSHHHNIIIKASMKVVAALLGAVGGIK